MVLKPLGSIFLKLTATLFLVASMNASTVLSVSGLANIFFSGQASTSGIYQGNLPTEYLLSAGAIRVEFPSVTGIVDYWTGSGFATTSTGDGTPDIHGAGGTNLALAGSGLSGVQYLGTNFFMVGVFLDASTPSGTGPATIAYNSSNTLLSSYTPLLNQIFFIGDGQGTAGTQTFWVPTGATRLLLGFADGVPGFTGEVGAYTDNSGALRIVLDEITEIPEPGTLLLGTTGLALLAAYKLIKSRRASRT